MKTVTSARTAALRAIGPLAAGVLSLFLITFTAAGQQAAPSPKTAVQAKAAAMQTAGAQGKTTDAAKPAAQSPYAGAMMKVAKVVVPDVRGRTPSEARGILEHAGLKFGMVQQDSGPGTPGTIWRQNPERNAVANLGSAVNVEVVPAPKPPPPDQHDNEFSRVVPSLVGRTPTQAQMILNHTGLNLGNQAAGPGNGVEGTIYAQNPQPGKWLPVSSRVDVQIVQASQPQSHNRTPERPQVIVPQLLGLRTQAAQQVLANSKLQIGSASTRQVSAPAGTIYDQKPQAGTRVYVGTSVDLLVAAEKPAQKPGQKPAQKPVLVPDIRHRDANTAAAILQRYRLGVGQQTSQESETDLGLITSQSPQPGTKVEAGSRVDIVVAVEIPPVTVPNVVHLDEGTAATNLGESRLRMGSLTQRDSDEVSGTVLAQNPAAGARVPRDSNVNLTVSRQIPRTLTVMADDPNPEVGKNVQFHAHLDQEAAGFQYQFVYGDGKQSGWTSRSIVAHAYETPGSYVVTAVASRGAVKVPSASVGVSAREIVFHPTLTAAPPKANRGDVVTFTVKNDRKDIRPFYQFEFADGTHSEWSEEPFVQHRYEHGGTYLTEVHARLRADSVVETTAQTVEVRGPVIAALMGLLIAVGLTGAGLGAFVYHGWKQFLKLVRVVPRMDAGELGLEMQDRESLSEDARLRMVWPRGEQLVEWAQGYEPRKAEGHD